MNVTDFSIDYTAYYACGVLTLYNGKKKRFEAWVLENVFKNKIEENDLIQALNKITFMLNEDKEFYVTLSTFPLIRTVHTDSIYFLIPCEDNMYFTIYNILTSQEFNLTNMEQIEVTYEKNPELFDILLKLLIKL